MIRRKTNDEQQDVNVHEEKRNIYLPCTPNLSRLYGAREWEVFGLWFGARGTTSKPPAGLQSFLSNIKYYKQNLIDHNIFLNVKKKCVVM